MNKLKPEAIALLQAVKQDILDHADQFDMAYWHRYDGRNCNWIPGSVESTEEIHSCNTSHCIAGFIQLRVNKAGNASFIAKRALDLEYPDVGPLFFMAQWPDHLKYAYRYANSRKERAQIAAQRIDQFIEELNENNN